MTLLDFMLWGGMFVGIFFCIYTDRSELSPILFRGAALTLACSCALVMGMRL